jgi:thiamine-monophosphate kinase
MNHPPQLVKDLGEQQLLAKLQSFCPSEIVGDDGAVVDIESDRRLVVTTDVLVDNVHFSDRTTSAFDVGWRAAAANLSDLAAMGATPVGIVVGLSLPGETSVVWVEELYRGLQQCLTKYNTNIIGGDVCRSTVITVAITAFGQVAPERVIRRDRAQVGDAIVVTGVHGASRAGLELLLHPESGVNLTNAEREELIAAHQRPEPRLDAIEHLKAIEINRAIAGMDSSDGLADAIVQICRSSGVGACIERCAIPIPSALDKIVTTAKIWEWVLYGGEDFELVLCLPQPEAEHSIANLNGHAAIVGKIVDGDSVIVINKDDPSTKELLTLAKGFQHFYKT